MTDFFSVYTYTPWDGLNTNQLTQIRLLSLKNIFKKFPVIEQVFFDDLISKVYDNNHYSWSQTIKRIVGPNNEDYNIADWNFVWAFDDQRRMFQFLFQKIKKEEIPQGILVALAPPELGQLLVDYKSEALLKTLSLLNMPSKIKFLMILAPKGKSLAEEQQVFQFNREYLDKMRFINTIGKMPNIKGQWFPAYEPKCPICNELMTNISGLDYKVGFGQLICTKCGYKKEK